MTRVDITVNRARESLKKLTYFNKLTLKWVIGEESKYSNLGVIKSVLRPLSHSHPALLHDKG